MVNAQNNEGSGLPYSGLRVPMDHEHILHICAHTESSWMRGAIPLITYWPKHLGGVGNITNGGFR